MLVIIIIIFIKTALMRGDGPVVFAQVKFGPGVDEIVTFIEQAWTKSNKEDCI
jgi:hypothetical protein